MEIKLYHYAHCPYCLRVRMTLGYLNLSYESIVVAYDDEITPKRLTGLKMLPIISINGVSQNESLEIMEILDRNNILEIKSLKKSENFNQLENLLSKLATNIHNLAMPHWAFTPEFNESARKYFILKKEEKRGPFKLLIEKRKFFEEELQNDLIKLERELKPFYHSESFSGLDILLASHLWGLYIVPEFQFSKEMHNYLQSVKNITHFNYHQDFWKE
jgi:glutaredoxin 2